MSEQELINRVMKCRDDLAEIGVKSARYYFNRKYPEYRDDKLNNLWYCKIADKDFTKKLESFTRYKKTEFKN